MIPLSTLEVREEDAFPIFGFQDDESKLQEERKQNIILPTMRRRVLL